MADEVRISCERLVRFCRSVFVSLGLAEGDARVAGDVLIAADTRGIPSHGVARLWRYVNGLQTGLMLPKVEPQILVESDMSLVIDARGGMGAPISARTMEAVIDKAASTGSAFASVRDSNHFGIAGYYAMKALDRDMLGIAMTNTAALSVPTFGREAMVGTNPIAFAAPADREKAFVLDMSTTVVTRGKIEVYERKEKPLPLGWAVGKTGEPATDATVILKDMQERLGGGILPLGGDGEAFGGHKGYGMAVLVDILCAVLGGAPFGRDVRDTATSSARVSHFFGAVRIDRFRDPQDFRRDMDDMLERLRTSPPAVGTERVYFAGLKEAERERDALANGVALSAQTHQGLCDIGRDLDIEI